MIKAYLAGPTVFYSDPMSKFEELKNIATQYGIIGICPFDNVLKFDNESPNEKGCIIAKANMQLIQETDVVIADLSMFRGLEPDSGTCFEIGYAVALNKPVHVYFATDELQNEELKFKIASSRFKHNLNIGQKTEIEDFQFPVNLMFGATCKFHNSFVECCKEITK